MALLCIWCISFTSVKAVSMLENYKIQSRFEHIVSKGDTGGGDGQIY